MAAGLSSGNPAIKRLRKLSRSAKLRRSEGVVVVEGPRAVRTAVDAGATVDAVFVETGRHDDLVIDLTSEDIDVRPVAAGLLDRVLATTSPQPIAAVVARPETEGPLPPARDGEGPVLVLAGIGDPGNVGTIIRSIVASRSGPVLVGPGSADPYGPKAVRASVGTVFHAAVHETLDLTAALGDLRASGRSILGAAPRGGQPHHDADLNRSIAIVLGGETAGLPDAVADDDRVSIAQLGPVESINVAMAATVLVFEAARQRQAGNSP